MENPKSNQLLVELSKILRPANSSDGAFISDAMQFATQISLNQIQSLIAVKVLADAYNRHGFKIKSQQYINIYETYLALKQYDQSDIYIMKLIENYSLRKFMDSGLKLNVDKKS